MSEMRELLERWAAAEPERCRFIEGIKSFAIKADDSRWWGLVSLGDLSEGANPIQVQAAVQQAIVARGWYINMFYHYEEWRAETGPKVPVASFSKANNPAEALLAAYLRALEATL